MNNILDKLGIYDLVGVLLTGISISVFTLFVNQAFYQYQFTLADLSQINETITFLVISYFLGLIFQELGSVCQRHIIYKNSRLLKEALKTSDTSHMLLSKKEKQVICTKIEKELHLDKSPNNYNIIYNYCRFYMINQGNTSKIDKDQSLAAMSRSFSLYFLILSLFSVGTFLWEHNFLLLTLSGFSLLLSCLFYYRFKRFCLMRYVYIFRYYYYSMSKTTDKK